MLLIIFIEGIGFGIASDYESMNIYRDKIFGLHMATQVEKGILFIAMLEEAIGFIFNMDNNMFAYIFKFRIKLFTNVFTIFLINLGKYFFLNRRFRWNVDNFYPIYYKNKFGLINLNIFL